MNTADDLTVEQIAATDDTMNAPVDLHPTLPEVHAPTARQAAEAVAHYAAVQAMEVR